MRLIELGANKPSFHTIYFNPTGVSIITAIRETDQQKKTYNSVGKSLSIALVHFCLASSNNKALEEKLSGWVFYLKFKIGDELYTSERATNNQSIISLNGVETSLTDFKKQLELLLFKIPEGSKFISFRSLISRFIRPFKSSYIKYDTYILKESKREYSRNLNNAFLLGLDPQRALEKYQLKSDLTVVEKSRKQLIKDPVIKRYFQGGAIKDVSNRLVNLKRKLKQLESDLVAFKVADNYHEIRKEADRLAQLIQEEEKERFKLEQAILAIDKSLERKPDLSKDTLLTLYKNAQVDLGKLVVRKLEDIEQFNQKLLFNRTNKLNNHKKNFVNKLNSLNVRLENLRKEKDYQLQYLNTHGALEEFVQLNNKITNLKIQVQSLEQFSQLKTEYTRKKLEISQKIAEEDLETLSYLEREKDTLDNNIQIFQDLVSQFYSDKISGISIDIDRKNNLNRYLIEANIEDDGGDAVNEVKIFCFDWTILKLQQNHQVKFLYHDSRITDGMDTRQIKTLLELAKKEAENNGYQYIISLNDSVLKSLEIEMTESSYKNIIEDNIVLRLSDKSNRDKLLGVQVNLDYEY